MERAIKNNMGLYGCYFDPEIKNSSMKIIASLLLFGLFFQSGHSQTRGDKSITASRGLKNSVLFYSQEEDALIIKGTGYVHSELIVIESLPYSEKLTIPVYVDQHIKGTYSFTKHPALQLPEYYTVIITDNLTGKTFDLINEESYTFQVDKDEPERFVLQIDKIKTTLTAMR